MIKPFLLLLVLSSSTAIIASSASPKLTTSTPPNGSPKLTDEERFFKKWTQKFQSIDTTGQQSHLLLCTTPDKNFPRRLLGATLKYDPLDIAAGKKAAEEFVKKNPKYMWKFESTNNSIVISPATPIPAATAAPSTVVSPSAVGSPTNAQPTGASSLCASSTPTNKGEKD